MCSRGRKDIEIKPEYLDNIFPPNTDAFQLVGTATVRGERCDDWTVTLPSGLVEHFYLSQRTGLPIQWKISGMQSQTTDYFMVKPGKPSIDVYNPPSTIHCQFDPKTSDAAVAEHTQRLLKKLHFDYQHQIGNDAELMHQFTAWMRFA